MIIFLFHIEIEGKGRGIIGVPNGMLAPLSNYWGGGGGGGGAVPPPFFLRLCRCKIKNQHNVIMYWSNLPLCMIQISFNSIAFAFEQGPTIKFYFHGL